MQFYEIILEFENIIDGAKRVYLIKENGYLEYTDENLIMYDYYEANKKLLERIIQAPEFRDNYMNGHYNNIKKHLGKIYPEELI